jgi:hypothetical protein
MIDKKYKKSIKNFADYRKFGFKKLGLIVEHYDDYYDFERFFVQRIILRLFLLIKGFYSIVFFSVN